jgi:hypothetical protein
MPLPALGFEGEAFKIAEAVIDYSSYLACDSDRSIAVIAVAVMGSFRMRMMGRSPFARG